MFVTDEVRNWVDARDHCALFGGWLVSIQDVHEQNCLMRHAYNTDGLTDLSYWTDGKPHDQKQNTFGEGKCLKFVGLSHLTFFGPQLTLLG